MNAINLTVNVQLDFSEETKKFIAALFTPCGCVSHVPEPAIAPEPTPVPAPAPVEPEPTVTTEQAPTKSESLVTSGPEPVKATPAVGIEDVRMALQEKVNTHREAIKAKLTEYGAPNVTKLDPAHYDEMYNFLKNLD